MGRAMQAYFDHNATTPLDEGVLEEMLPFLREEYGNASSRHDFGTRARRAVNKAREQIAALVNVQPAQRLSYLVSADALGRWAYHCHMLYHMEAGMFREVVVAHHGDSMEHQS